MPTTITGTIKKLDTTTPGVTAYVRFWLRGTRGNEPRITGTGAIAPQFSGSAFYVDLPADASGNISGTIYSTRDAAGTGAGDIEAGGSYTAVYYGMQIFNGGVAGPETPVHAKNGGTLDIANISPVSALPVISAPTGDSTYARIDGGNTPFTGAVTFAGNALVKNLNGIVYADQFPGADAGEKIAAAIAALPATGGTVAASGLSGTQTISSTVTLSKAVRLVLGAGTYQTSVAPAFDITGGGVSLEGLDGGSPLSSNCPTVIKAIVGCTGPIVRMNLASQSDKSSVRRFKIDGNSIGTVTACLQVAPNQVNLNIYEDLAFTGTPTGILLGAGGGGTGNIQNQRFDRIGIQGVTTAVDGNSTAIRDVIFRDCRMNANTTVFTIGTDDNTGINRSYQVKFLGCDLETVAGTSTTVGTVRNCRAFVMDCCWIETDTPSSVTSMIVLGSASSIPISTVISNTYFNGDSNASYCIDLLSPTFVSITNCTFFGANTACVKVTTATSFGVIWGCSNNSTAGDIVTAQTGLISVQGHSTLLSNTARFPQGIQSDSNLSLIGTISKYNNINTAGSGISSILGSTSQKAETAADTNVLTVTPPSSAGSYRLRFTLSLSAATTATVGWTATWKDSNGAAQSPTNLALYQSGTAGTALTFTTSAAGNYYGETQIDIDNSGTNIVIKMTFSGTSFSGKASAVIEKLI